MAKAKPTILVCDDEASIRESFNVILQDNYHVIPVPNGREALDQVRTGEIDLVLLDIKMPDIDGMEVLERIKSLDDSVDVIMVTATKTVATAVEAMKQGAYDYITKPFDVDQLMAVVKRVMENRTLRKENKYLRSEITASSKYKIVGESKVLQDIFRIIEDVAKSHVTVLIQGESGTGKELVARAIHSNSNRADKLFVAVNCAAIPENLIESELFGHEKGAFTSAFERKIGKFEIAHGGTIFLDEISCLPLSMQSKLLRVLQEKEVERVGGNKTIPVDIRVISATNMNLKEAVEKGAFREDLFYRLNVVPINMPPLRERRDDIPLLTRYFLEKYSRDFGKNVREFSEEAMEVLVQYDWPGNVRELQNFIEKMVVLGRGEIVGIDRLPIELTKQPEAGEGAPSALFEQVGEGMTLKDATRLFERQFIKRALEKVGGSKTKAAKLLGIHRNTLLQKQTGVLEDGADGVLGNEPR